MQNRITNADVSTSALPFGKPLLSAAISSVRGVATIDYFTKSLQKWLLKGRTNPIMKESFLKIFGKDDAKYLQDKWLKDNGTGGWFLNLDNKNQVKFLRGICPCLGLNFPQIDNWESIGIEYGLCEDFDMEDVRLISVGFKDVSEWEYYPHDLIWIRKFSLYASNFGIKDDKFNGQKFGHLENWMYYWFFLSDSQKISYANALQSY
ncbi:MAG: hypothetical protein KA327_07105 [Pseudarcicella sp.]|nr:hypothetical protein [Pseudarcicella sp.]